MGRSRIDLDPDSASLATDGALIPVDPGMSIGDVVAQVRGAGTSQVELLVPNNTLALQGVGGCQQLALAASEGGIRVTLFTADEMTLAAARVAKLDTVPVDSTIIVPHEESRERPPAFSTFRKPNEAPPPAPFATRSASVAALPPLSDQDFLAGLRAFDESLSPRELSDGETLETAEGAVLFDAAGDRGARRPASRAQEAWESAIVELETTMVTEPVGSNKALEAVRPPELVTGEAARRVNARDALLESLSGVSPGKSSRTKGGGRAGSMPHAAPAGREDARGNGANRLRRLSLWPLALVSALALAVIGWFVLARYGFGGAEITLAPPAPVTEPTQVANLTIPLSDKPVADLSSYAIHGALLEQPVRVTVQGEAISTTTAPIGLASGVLLLRNTLSQPLLLRAGTIVPASNGVQFTVDADVTIPAATASEDGITFGRGQVRLTATVPGAAGNIPPGSIRAIPGYEGTLRVEQGAFTGGSDQEVRVVRIEDVNRELPRAVSQLYEAGVQALAAAAGGQPGLALVAETIRPTVESLQRLDGIEYAAFPPIGGVTTDGAFTLEVRTAFSGVVHPDPSTFDAEITRATRNLLVNTHNVAPDSRVEVTDWSVGEQGFVVAAAVYPPSIVPPLEQEFLAEVERRLAGLPETEAKAYLDSLVEEGRIGGYSDLPVDDGALPSRLHVTQAES